jgi:uncharacterized protein (TIGR02246 family)
MVTGLKKTWVKKTWVKKTWVTALSTIGVVGALLVVAEFPTPALALTEPELTRVATELSRQYDASYAAKDPAAMAMVYADDGVLVSPPGPIIRGREAIKAYYVKRFASGARGHAIKVLEVHVLGDGGYSIDQFTVTVPQVNGTLREEHGTIVAVYRRDRAGWHLSLIAPSVPEMADK